MTKKSLILLGIVLVVMQLGVVGCFAHDYEKETSDHPGRMFSYVCHPFGFAAEWAVVRPVHWFVSLPGINKVCGHNPYDTDTYFGEKPRKSAPKKAKSEMKSLADVQKAEADNQKKEAEQKEIDGKNKEIDDLKAQLADKEKELADTKAQIEGKDKEAAQAKEELEKLKVEMTNSQKAFTFNMLDSVLFETGSAVISQKGKEALTAVATMIKEKYADREIIIQGHTDTQQFKEGSKKTNWELGSERSLAILHFLTKEAGFAPEKIQASTCGEYKPAADNGTPEGKAQNRRAIILVMPTNITIEKAGN